MLGKALLILFGIVSSIPTAILVVKGPSPPFLMARELLPISEIKTYKLPCELGMIQLDKGLSDGQVVECGTTVINFTPKCSLAIPIPSWNLGAADPEHSDVWIYVDRYTGNCYLNLREVSLLYLGAWTSLLLSIAIIYILHITLRNDNSLVERSLEKEGDLETDLETDYRPIPEEFSSE